MDESIDLSAAGSPPAEDTTAASGAGSDSDMPPPPNARGRSRMAALLADAGSPAPVGGPRLASRRRRPSRSSQVPVTLEACLRKTCAASSLSGDNQYHCDGCRGKRDAERRELLSHLPQVLIVHLSRAFWTARGKTKSQVHVDFPMGGLDLAPFCSKEARVKPDPRAESFRAAARSAATPVRDVAASLQQMSGG